MASADLADLQSKIFVRKLKRAVLVVSGVSFRGCQQIFQKNLENILGLGKCRD